MKIKKGLEMLSEMKDIIYVGGAIAIAIGNWYAIKFQSKQNSIEIDKISSGMKTGFSKLEKIDKEVSQLKSDSSHYLTVTAVQDSHPTKSELDIRLKHLQDTDNAINSQISKLDKKMDKIIDLLMNNNTCGKLISLSSK